jgi:Uma2 family endonuclease
MTVALDQQIVYPDSDGQPMADNTKQFSWIVLLKENLECLFANDPNVFVAGDLLWYPVEGKPEIRVAPDVLVALGRPKGDGAPTVNGRKGINRPRWYLKYCPLVIVSRR